MKKLTALFASLALLVSACTVELTADIYVQDIVEVQEFGETLYTNATLALQFSGDAEDKQKITGLLEDYLFETSNIREETRNSSNYLVIDYKIPLVAANEVSGIYNATDIQNHIFAFGVTPESLNFAVNRSLFNQLDQELYSEFYQHLTFEDFAMKLFLRNDSREATEVTLYSVYANTTPIPYTDTLTLERRDEVEIRFSDVLRDSAFIPTETETGDISVRKFADIGTVTQ